MKTMMWPLGACISIFLVLPLSLRVLVLSKDSSSSHARITPRKTSDVLLNPELKRSSDTVVESQSNPKDAGQDERTAAKDPNAGALPEAVSRSAAVPTSSDDDIRLGSARTLLKFKEELALSKQQKEYFERVLLERDTELSTYHAQVRASKVFSIWEHEKKVRGILITSQLRLVAILDSVQEQRFHELYEQHLVIEGVSFEITPEMTVIR